MIRSLRDIDLHEKRVFLRVDCNCPIGADGRVADDTRIRAVLPTIRHCLEQKARVILASHLGRPGGTGFDERYSLAPVGERLAELLDDMEIALPEDCIGDAAKKLAHELLPGQVLLLENLRFHAEEEKNDPKFAETLAALAEVYVNDAFGACHRAHASVVGVPALMTQKAAGFLLEKEVEYLGRLLEAPERPFVIFLGGAKVTDKIELVEALLAKADVLCIGGAMAYTFLRAKEVPVGRSHVEEAKVYAAGKLLSRAETRGVRVCLPRDHVIAKALSVDAERKTTADATIPDGWIGCDIGPKTIAAFTRSCREAKTIFWNGPFGWFEASPFAEGTNAVARAIAASGAVTVVGGGDSVVALRHSGVIEKITHVSTGGGASMQFLEGRGLPGVTALEG